MEGIGNYFTTLLNNGGYDSNFEDIVQPAQSPITESTPLSQSTRKQKGKNFTEDEDRLLVSAWLNVSTDPTNGTNQTKDAFWTRVCNYYQINKGQLSERSQGSLSHRWVVIQEAVSKFCGCIAQIEGRNQSGLTIHDREEQAEILYKSIPGNKSFQFRHCWLILRNQPKWHDRMKQLANLKTCNKKQKATKVSSPGVVDLEAGNEDDTPQPVTLGTDTPKRPIEKKRAKEALRRGGNEACVAALDILWAKKKEADAEKELKKRKDMHKPML